MNTENKHFDSKAKDWDTPEKINRAVIFAKEINNFIKPNKQLSAMEFGCGTGLLSFELKDAFKTITLIDTSEGMMDVLKEKIENEKAHHFSPKIINVFEEKLEEKFDVIYTLMTMHHIDNTKGILTIFNRLLNNNGYLCIADLVAEDGSFHPKSQNFTGHNGFDREELENKLKENGFNAVYYTTPVIIKKEVEGLKREYPLFLLIAKKI